MDIIAKTKDGCLITATDKEVTEILTSVNGKAPEKISIGQKIPAIDYASTITKIKALKDDYDYRHILDKVESFNVTVDNLKEAIDNAGSIDI